MLRKHVFTLSVLSLLVMGQAMTARAADSAAPSDPGWAAAVVPADGGCVVQIARARRMVGKRRRKYLVCKKRWGKNPDLCEFLR
jgi:hypothetical protein